MNVPVEQTTQDIPALKLAAHWRTRLVLYICIPRGFYTPVGDSSLHFSPVSVSLWVVRDSKKYEIVLHDLALASSPPPASQVILAIASSLSNADNALRGYAAAVEEWARYLKELKDLEDEVGNIMRDREILVTRLLKASKSTPKPSSNRDSFMFPSSPPASSSTLSLKSNEDPSTTYASTSFFSSLTPGPLSATKKMQAAQAELQACEAHLAKKELELDGKRSSAMRDGLRVRFHALAQCGWRWTEIGKEVEIVLGFGEQASPPSTSSKPLPALIAPVPVHAKPPTAEFHDHPSSDLSSIAPSQSASQIGSPPLIIPSTSHIYSDLEVASDPPASPPLNDVAALSLQIPIPPAHSIDDRTLPTADSDATITRSAPRRHVLPHRITEEDLGLKGAIHVESAHEGSGDSDSDEDNEHIPSDARVVENPRFSTRKAKNTNANPQLGLTSSPSKVNTETSVKTGNRRASINISASGSGSGGGFFGSIRGLFTRQGRTSVSNRSADSPIGTAAALIDDSSSIDESQHPGVRGKGRRNKTRIGLLGGKNKKKGAGIFSDDEKDGSVMSSPPFSTPVSRGRTLSEANSSTRTPSRTNTDTGNTGNPGKKLKKSGPGVGLRERTASNDLSDGVKQKRRSASVDYGDLSVRSRNTSRPRSRAEEWVDGQRHEALAMEDKDRSERDVNQPIVLHSDDESKDQTSSLKKKSSVKRRKSDNRRSLPASSSKSASTSALVLLSSTLPTSDSSPIPNKTAEVLHETRVEPSASVSRNSSIRSAASAPSGPRTHGTPRASVIRAHTLTLPHNDALGTKAVPITTTISASSPPKNVSTENGVGGSAVGGSTSLMSIVEDVAKANREAWDNAEEGKNRSSESTALKKSVGGTIKPISLLEIVKAPQSIDFEDLKEQMDRDLRELKEKNPSNHHQPHYTGRARSGSVSAAAPHHGHLLDAQDTIHSDVGPSTSASAPTLSAIPVVNDNSQVQTRHMPFKPGQVVLPLRSALKNPSRTPSPMLQQPQSSQVEATVHSEQSSSPSGSQLGSNISTAGSSGSAKSGRNRTGVLPPHQHTRTASPLANTVLMVMSPRDVKGKGRALSNDALTVSGASSGVIPSPTPSNLSNSTPSTPSPSMLVVYPDQALLERRDSDSDSGSDSSDAASMSSYETGREGFDDAEDAYGVVEDGIEDSGDETETDHGLATPPAPPKDDERLPQTNVGCSGSDISISSTSTETLTRTPQAQVPKAIIAGISIPGLTESNTAVNATTTTTHVTGLPPRRRKSVRVSLQPTYSVTPPAIEYDDEDEIGIGMEERNHSWRSDATRGSDTDESSGENGRSDKRENQTDGVPGQDIWTDSSDEDAEYQKARKLFSMSSTLAKKSDSRKAKSRMHR
ncbi:hypothetical protein J3R30DRAFT_3400058 [Lentinula aciculospora]|uniref:Uncharacterized protein n=1 Tax=Lentinula aciculospora TaxID=153920 RepID=A0A9W9DY98_9AGAR|nr:hypothetical protein J3R30DRAFT_3400058 [Lentinula aciculospora]